MIYVLLKFLTCSSDISSSNELNSQGKYIYGSRRRNMFGSHEEHAGSRNRRAPILNCAVIFLILLGAVDFALGARSEGFQIIHQNEIRGVLINVPLREVLSHFEKRLGVDSVVEEDELDTPISVELSGETLVKALPKILSAWDYALQTDEQGNVRRIFIVRKSTETRGEPVDYETEISPNSELSNERFVDPAMLEGTISARPGHEDLEEEEPISPTSSVASAKLQQMLLPENSGSPEGGVASPMMEISDSGSHSMDVIPASSLPEMNIIPASAYPPMEILPVSEEDRKAFGGPSKSSDALTEQKALP